MQSFESYLLSEYQLSNEVVCNKFSYTHSVKQKLDKKSSVPIVNNIINVHIESYDEKHNLIAAHSEKFVDGVIKRGKNKKLINISPDELNNRFSTAKSSIISLILHEYNTKLNDLQLKIKDLNKYAGPINNIIPMEFVNEPLIGEQNNNNNNNGDDNVVKKNFEF